MTGDAGVITRAGLSRGRADGAVHALVAELLRARRVRGVAADIGCGTGEFWRAAGASFDRCIGVDVFRYEGLPPQIEFVRADLDRPPTPLDAATVDVAVAIEVIEHLENPRALVRELVRITKPGGWIAITTPNQLSALSLVTLVWKGQFSAFQATDYPAHRTALLDVDLRRIAGECGLEGVEIAYTRHGRIPLTGRHYARFLASASPRRLSDNVAMIGRTP